MLNGGCLKVLLKLIMLWLSVFVCRLLLLITHFPSHYYNIYIYIYIYIYTVYIFLGQGVFLC